MLRRPDGSSPAVEESSPEKGYEDGGNFSVYIGA
jgi:hypothetical protein